MEVLGQSEAFVVACLGGLCGCLFEVGCAPSDSPGQFFTVEFGLWR